MCTPRGPTSVQSFRAHLPEITRATYIVIVSDITHDVDYEAHTIGNYSVRASKGDIMTSEICQDIVAQHKKSPGNKQYHNDLNIPIWRASHACPGRHKRLITSSAKNGWSFPDSFMQPEDVRLSTSSVEGVDKFAIGSLGSSSNSEAVKDGLSYKVVSGTSERSDRIPQAKSWDTVGT
ncbi:unnamed protein product [Protopolystoma xenopodis]|uniref:Uncharacterized protein n=1 Tax=Protopolystoma xenopodis TaxID=117903 RepID=A0A3S5BCP3_9PLAT|nr:unnamed protein product [Protopolystoma xenopodis]